MIKDGFCPFIPFQRISFDEAYRLYGTDKPDLRIPWTIEDCTDYFFFLNSQNMEEFCVRFIVAKGAAKYLADAELKSWHQTKMDKKCQVRKNLNILIEIFFSSFSYLNY